MCTQNTVPPTTILSTRLPRLDERFALRPYIGACNGSLPCEWLVSHTFSGGFAIPTSDGKYLTAMPKDFESPPDFPRPVLYPKEILELSGPGGYNASGPRRPTRKPIIFDPSLYPDLKTLIISNNANPSDTLSLFFSSPKSCALLKHLQLWNCGRSETFDTSLADFISRREDAGMAALAVMINGHKFHSGVSTDEVKQADQEQSEDKTPALVAVEEDGPESLSEVSLDEEQRADLEQDEDETPRAVEDISSTPTLVL